MTGPLSASDVGDLLIALALLVIPGAVFMYGQTISRLHVYYKPTGPRPTKPIPSPPVLRAPAAPLDIAALLDERDRFASERLELAARNGEIGLALTEALIREDALRAALVAFMEVHPWSFGGAIRLEKAITQARAALEQEDPWDHD